MRSNTCPGAGAGCGRLGATGEGAAELADDVHQPVHVGGEAREGIVEVAGELQEVDDLLVEALARDQQRDPGRIRRQQRAELRPRGLLSEGGERGWTCEGNDECACEWEA